MKLPFVFERKRSPSEPQEDLQEYLDTESAGRSCSDPLEAESIRGLSDLYCPQPAGELCLERVGNIADVLLEMGKLTPGQYTRLQQEYRRGGVKSSGDAVALLLKAGLINADDVLEARAKLCGLEFRHIAPEDIDKVAFEQLDIDFIKSSSVCPIAIKQDTLIIATSEPENVFVIEDVKRQTQKKVQVVVCNQEDIDVVCRLFENEKFKDEGFDYSLDDIISDMTDVEVVAEQKKDIEDLEKMAGQSPVIKFVNYLISNAIRDSASDIHVEPKGEFTKIRYRIDGVLFEIMQSPSKMHPAIVSRIKIMANLDISERRLPQDGRITAIVGARAVDLRVSTLPTNHGEKVVIRILDGKSIMWGFDQLGMEADVRAAFRRQITLPHGILLVTGPTGSGKSTTLYSALCQMDGDKLNISTVEDPVEYELDFCNQMQVNEKIGLDFATALRSLLRQDPDIIMIGEIRDNQTARIAVQAALTGHLVLSTLHTNDAASSITRLVDIGIDPYLIAASLNGVLAQRLVRKTCPKCKKVYKVPQNMRKFVKDIAVKPQQLFRGAGCEYCRNSGYAGRTGIYELLALDETFRDMIHKDSSVNNMRHAFRKSGQPTLFDDGIKKVKQGLTTIEEVLRVTEVLGQSEEKAFVENMEQ